MADKKWDILEFFEQMNFEQMIPTLSNDLNIHLIGWTSIWGKEKLFQKYNTVTNKTKKPISFKYYLILNFFGGTIVLQFGFCVSLGYSVVEKKFPMGYDTIPGTI